MRQLSQSLAANLAVLDKMFGTSADYYAKEITIYHCRGSILLFDGMASLDSLWELLLDAASRQAPPQQAGRRCTGPQVFELILHGSAFPAESEPVTDLADLIKRMTAGMAVLLLDGCAKGIAFSVQGLKFRSVDEPSGEGNLRGSREGFADLLRVNLSLLRRLIRTEHLVQEVAQADTEMQTEYAICYCKNRADSAMVIRVRKALAAAKPELLLDSSYFVPWLLPGRARLFTPVSYTERPAVAAAKICEGKIVVLVNGSPSAMVLPALFCENFECLDDYASTAVFSSFLRILKYVSFYLTVFLPGVFVCLAVYLPELIPPQLLYKIEAAEKATPLPLFAEMLLVILILEVIREAGLRMPQSLGHSVSLVSALIIGDAAIATGLMSTLWQASRPSRCSSRPLCTSLLRCCVWVWCWLQVLPGRWALRGLFLQFCSVFPAQPACRCHIWRRIRSRSGPWQRMASSAATTAAFQRTTLISGRNGRENDAKQKGFSAPVLALSVWTAALAEEMQTGISPRGMIIHGAVQALLLTCISGVFSACWQRAAMQWVWLFSAGAWFLAELFGTVMQAQNICQQEFRSMALIGLLPLLLWAGWCIPPSGWDAPARVLWWFVLLGGLVCLTGLAGQMDWAHLLTADAVQLARWPRVPLYAEYLFWPLLAGYEEPRSMSWLPWLTFLAQAGLTAGMCLVFGAADYPEQELLRAWNADVFSRMDALLLLIWLTCAIFRTGFLCAAVRTVWQRAVQCGKGAVK